MALPILQQPIFEVYLKSLDKKVKFRPFLVKEEKILLMARESDDNDSTVSAVKQVLQNCLITELDINTIPLFDVQMLFTHLRMKSIGETITLQYTCNHRDEEDNECGKENRYNLDLNKVRYETTPGHTNIIQLTDEIGIKLRYPTMNSKLTDSEDILEDSYKLIAEHLDSVFDSEQVYTDYTKEDLMQFIDGLSADQLDKILNFFATSPKVILEDVANCKKCGTENKIYAEDLYSFFI
jgi:T4 bacteriophage base plate protein